MITVYGLKAFMPQLKGLVRDIRTVWTLEELGLPYEQKKMDALKKEHKEAAFLALNPFGKVPTIQDGEVTLFESSAICTYLGEKAGKLLPTQGTAQRHKYDQWMAFANSTLEPLCSRVVGIDFFEQTKSEALTKYRNETLELATGMVAALDAQLAARSYILGEAFSIADIMLSSVLRMLSHTEVTAKYPNVIAYLLKNFSRPAFARAHEKNG